MADLDDFFAKKDKKKSKVKKFTASELLNSSKYQQGEDVAAAPTGVPKKQPAEKPKKEEVVQESVESENVPAKSKPTGEAEDEEWGEFEQEKERDYSGLKIQKLQIQDSEDDYGEDSGEQELNEEGEPIKKEPTGPWNKIGAQPTPNCNLFLISLNFTFNVSYLILLWFQSKWKKLHLWKSQHPTQLGVFIFHQANGISLQEEAAAAVLQLLDQELVSGTGSLENNFCLIILHLFFAGKKEKGAPDLANEEYFPTLSAAVAIEQNNFKLKK